MSSRVKMASTKPEHMVAADVEPAKTFKMDPNLLDCFWKLAEVNDDVRIQASLWLSDELKKLQHQHEATEAEGSLCPELQYSVKRLLKGLSSARKAARLGFYTALTEILVAFPALLPSQLVFKLIGIVFSAKNKKEEGKHTVIGQCLAYSALVRLGNLAEDDPSFGIIVKVLSKASKKNTNLEKFCCDLLNTVFLSINESSFQSIVFPSLKKILTAGWDDANPMKIWVLFRTAELFPNVVDGNFLAAYWGSRKLIRKNVFPQLAKIMMKSTHAHPDIHPVALAINNAAIGTSAFADYWKQVVVHSMVGNQKEKTYLAYELLREVLPKLNSSEQVRAILAPNLVRNFTQNLSYPNSMLHAAAKQLAYFISTSVENWEDEEMQFSFVRQLIDYPGLMNFDQDTRTKTIAVMTRGFKADGVKMLTEFLKEAITGSPPTDNQNVLASENNRQFATHQLERLLKLRVMSKEIAWQTDVLKFLLLHAYFSVGGVDKKKGFSKVEPLSKALQQHLSDSFYRALETVTRQLYSKWRPSLQSYCNMIYDLVLFANDLLHAQSVTLRHPFEKKTLLCWDLMWKTVAELHKVSPDASKSTEGQALEQLLLQRALQLFMHPKENIPVIAEVVTCYSKAFKKQKNKEKDEEPVWMEVIVDLLLSLLSQGHHKLRPVVLSVFSLLVPTISTRTLKLVLDVIDPEARRDDDDDNDDDGPLMTQEDSDYEDENSEDEDVLKTKAKDDGSEEADSSDSESDTDPEAEEGGDVDEGLKADLHAALGDAAELSDKDLSDMDDEEMTKVDKALAEVFRLRKKKKNVADLPLMHFRIRCVDLIDVVVDFNPSPPLMAACILPLMSAFTYALHTKQQDPLYHRVATTLKNLVQIKKFSTSDAVDHPDYLKIWQQLLTITEKTADPQTVKNITRSAELLYRCITSLPPETQKDIKPTIISDCQMVLTRFFSEKSCHVHRTFFSTFMAQLDFASELLVPLLEFSINPDVIVFKRTQGLKLLHESILHHPEVLNEWTKDQWNANAKKLGCHLNSVLEELVQGVEAKPMQLLELLNVIHTFVRHYERKWAKPLLILPQDTLIRSYGALPKPAKKLFRKILPPKTLQMLLNLPKMKGTDNEKAEANFHKAVKLQDKVTGLDSNISNREPEALPQKFCVNSKSSRISKHKLTLEEPDKATDDDDDNNNDDSAKKPIQKSKSMLEEPEENADDNQSDSSGSEESVGAMEKTNEERRSLKETALQPESVSRRKRSKKQSPSCARINDISTFADKESSSESELGEQSADKKLHSSLFQETLQKDQSKELENGSTTPSSSQRELCDASSNKRHSNKKQSLSKSFLTDENELDLQTSGHKSSLCDPPSNPNASVNTASLNEDAPLSNKKQRRSVTPAIGQNDLKSGNDLKKKLSDGVLSHLSETDASLNEDAPLSNKKQMRSATPAKGQNDLNKSGNHSNKKLSDKVLSHLSETDASLNEDAPLSNKKQRRSVTPARGQNDLNKSGNHSNKKLSDKVLSHLSETDASLNEDAPLSNKKQRRSVTPARGQNDLNKSGNHSNKKLSGKVISHLSETDASLNEDAPLSNKKQRRSVTPARGQNDLKSGNHSNKKLSDGVLSHLSETDASLNEDAPLSNKKQRRSVTPARGQNDLKSGNHSNKKLSDKVLSHLSETDASLNEDAPLSNKKQRRSVTPARGQNDLKSGTHSNKKLSDGILSHLSETDASLNEDAPLSNKKQRRSVTPARGQNDLKSGNHSNKKLSDGVLSHLSEIDASLNEDAPLSNKKQMRSVTPARGQNDLKSGNHSNKKLRLSDRFLSHLSETDSPLLEPQRLSLGSRTQTDNEEDLKLRLSLSPPPSPNGITKSPMPSNRKQRLSNSRTDSRSSEKLSVIKSPIPKLNLLDTSHSFSHTPSKSKDLAEEPEATHLAQISPQQFYKNSSAEKSAERRKSFSQSEDAVPSPKKRRSSKSISFVSDEHQQSSADGVELDTSTIVNSSKKKKGTLEKGLEVGNAEETRSTPSRIANPNSGQRRKLRSSHCPSNTCGKNTAEVDTIEKKKKVKLAAKTENLPRNEPEEPAKKTGRKKLETPPPTSVKKRPRMTDKQLSPATPRRSLRLLK